MAIDLSKLSDKALAKLQDDIGLEFKSREKSKREQARKDAEAAARKHGFSLSELVDGEKGSEKGRRSQRNIAIPPMHHRHGAVADVSRNGTRQQFHPGLTLRNSKSDPRCRFISGPKKG